MLKKFNCDMCGECCRHIHLVDGLKHLQTMGICKYLKGNKCTIYHQRPDLCQYEKVYSMCSHFISEDDFYNITLETCNQLKLIYKSKG